MHPEIESYIKNTGAQILHRFPLLHEGWEANYRGYILEMPDGSRRAVSEPLLAELRAENLQDLLGRYRAAIQSTTEALELLGTPHV